MGEFRMPSLGADMAHGTIVEWRVGPGDTVARGDIVAVVDTEKSDIEVEVFEAGTIGEIRVPVGVEVPVGAVLATIVSAGAGGRGSATPPVTPVIPAPAIPAPVIPAPALVPPAAPLPPAPSPTSAPRAGRSSPYARRRAAELGVDLHDVAARHPERPVQAGDVEAYAATPLSSRMQPRPAPTATERPSRPAARRIGAARETGLGAVGRLMERSKREIPHYYLSEDIDVSAALDWMEARNDAAGVRARLLPAALLLRAVVLAAAEVPSLNAHFVEGHVVPADGVHLAVAVSQRGGGLVAPVIADAGRLGLDELMAAMLAVVGRARSGTLLASDVTTATITVTNLGDQGTASVWGVIVPPQVAIVGFGRVSERPWAVDGTLDVRRVVTVTLSADHRVTHGHVGARFLRAIARVLEQPEELL